MSGEGGVENREALTLARVALAKIEGLEREVTLKCKRLDDHDAEIKSLGKVVYVVMVLGLFMSIAVAPFIRDYIVGSGAN